MEALSPDARVDRPESIEPCATCGELLGRGYPSCATCEVAVDQRWQADWAELTDPDPAEIVAAVPGAYRWTCVDRALRELRCPGCGGELAAGDPDCLDCAAADSARWELPDLDEADRQLRKAVVVLRAPDRHRAAIVSTCRLVVPFLLAGWQPTRADTTLVTTQVLAGRYDEMVVRNSLPLVVPLAPWRRSTV